MHQGTPCASWQRAASHDGDGSSLICKRIPTRQFKDREHQSGAYCQPSHTRAMRRRTDSITSDATPEIRRQVDNYKRFKELSDEWLDLIEQRLFEWLETGYAPDTHSDE